MRRLTAAVVAFSCACSGAPRADGRRAEGLNDELARAETGPVAAGAAGLQRPGSVRAPARETRRFDEVGTGQSLSHEPRDAAVSRAKEDALGKAMTGAADLFYAFSDSSEEADGAREERVSRFLFATSQALLTELTVSQPECSIAGRTTTCRLRVRGEMSLAGGVDPAYQILDQASGRRLGLDRRRYFDGDSVALALSVTRDSFIYAYSWDEQDRIHLIHPDRPGRPNWLRQGVALSLPAEGSGVALRAILPPGRRRVSERLLVIASRRELGAPVPEEPLTALMRRLATLERSEWTLQAFPYEIAARGE